MKRIAWLRGTWSVFALALVAGCGDGATVLDRDVDMAQIIEIQEELETTMINDLSQDIATGKVFTMQYRPIAFPGLVREIAREEGLDEDETEILLERMRASARAGDAKVEVKGLDEDETKILLERMRASDRVRQTKGAK